MRASVTSDMIAGLQSQLVSEDPGVDHVADSAPKIDISIDQRAGAHAATFHVTVSGSLGATVFKAADAEASMAAALEEQVPDGDQLAESPAITDIQVQASNTKGDITISAIAQGYMMAKVSAVSIRKKVSGLDAATATQVVQAVAPGSEVEIHVTPVPNYWLPRDADRITIDVVPAPPDGRALSPASSA